MSAPAHDESGSLQRFVAGALAREGAIVEARTNGLEVALPPRLAAALDLREFEHIVFTAEDASPDASPDANPDASLDASPQASAGADAGARLVDYDAPLIEKLAERIARHGSIASADARASLPKSIDAARALADSLTIQNGIARVVDAEIVTARYVGVVVQYDVLADERLSGTVNAWVCPDTRSVPDGLAHAWDEISTEGSDARSGAGDGVASTSVDAIQLASCVKQAWPVVQAISTAVVGAAIEPFLASLARRRDRDLDRVQQYYREIYDELARKAARHQGDARAREEARLRATVQAWRARVEEVVARYRARVTLAPVTAIVCHMPAWRVRLRLQRRTAVRDLAWICDGRGRALEPRACDHCHAPTRSAFLCDDRVHFLCRGCFAPCELCGKAFCRACRSTCVRCRK